MIFVVWKDMVWQLKTWFIWLLHFWSPFPR
jgi:hypothetical protein